MNLAGVMVLAQIDPKQLADGLTVAPLAWVCVVLTLAVGYLFRELRAEQKARAEDAANHHAETVETLTSIVTLSLKLGEGLDILDKAVDRLGQHPRRSDHDEAAEAGRG